MPKKKKKKKNRIDSAMPPASHIGPVYPCCFARVETPCVEIAQVILRDAALSHWPRCENEKKKTQTQHNTNNRSSLAACGSSGSCGPEKSEKGDTWLRIWKEGFSVLLDSASFVSLRTNFFIQRCKAPWFLNALLGIAFGTRQSRAYGVVQFATRQASPRC